MFGSSHLPPHSLIGSLSTPLRVMYTILEEWWLQWIGALKRQLRGRSKGNGQHHTVTNLMVDAYDHRPADPPIGPTVDDLAAALADYHHSIDEAD